MKDDLIPEEITNEIVDELTNLSEEELENLATTEPERAIIKIGDKEYYKDTLPDIVVTVLTNMDVVQKHQVDKKNAIIDLELEVNIAELALERLQIQLQTLLPDLKEVSKDS